jgi:hypothetical protein
LLAESVARRTVPSATVFDCVNNNSTRKSLNRHNA